MIEIGGKEFPLIFNYDAIAKVEAKYDASILVVQEDMARIEKVYDLLEAALGGEFTIDQLKSAKLPPVLALQGIIQSALYVAYFGDTMPEDEKSEEKPKGAKSKKKPKRQKPLK